jgi:hypothetical protein
MNITEDRIVGGAWDSYREHCVPGSASRVQVAGTQQAFFAGAMVVLDVCRKLGGPGVSEARGVELLGLISRELDAFARAQGVQS